MSISFKFLNKDSLSDMGIGVLKRPLIPTPERRVQQIPVKGRNGVLLIDEKSYSEFTIPVECIVEDSDIPHKADAIKAWLLGGSGSLIFSNDPNRKYNATVVNKFDIAEAIENFGEFIVMFLCQPFKYDIINSVITLNASGGTVVNTGTIYSEPKITVYGNGNISLTVNGNTVTLTGVNGSIVLDSVIEDCYLGTNNLNGKMTGEFPLLQVGNNLITWSGAVSKVEVIPNMRWL